MSAYHQARAEAQRGIKNLEKASEALRVFQDSQRSAQTIPARQDFLESIEKRMVSGRYEITEIDRLIEQAEMAWGE